MEEDLGHGPRLSDEEYRRSIFELHEGFPSMPSKEQDIEMLRRELELAIDHRLGRDFPKDRREALWEAKQKVESKRLRLAFKYALRHFFRKWFYREAQEVAGFMVDEYAKVLNKREIASFFGLKEGERPELPIDSTKI